MQSQCAEINVQQDELSETNGPWDRLIQSNILIIAKLIYFLKLSHLCRGHSTQYER